MWIAGRYFDREVVERITATLDSEAELSRAELSRRMCKWLEWRSPDGRLQEMGARKALLELDRRGLIALPERPAVGREPTSEGDGDIELPDGLASACCELSALGRVEIELVTSRHTKASRIWRALMERFHYLGAGPLCGAQLRYLVRSPTHGWLGALAFSASSPRLRARDEWIGWSEAARLANLQLVVCNSRFLILPTVEVPNLASHVLALATGRLRDDWLARYAYQPVLLETFVDGSRFSATSYRAANWVHVGQTAGRPTPFANGKVSSGPKEIYLYPLVDSWRSQLTEEPPLELELRGALGETGDWVEHEFVGSVLHDGRLRRRLHEVVTDFYAQPVASIPQACGGVAAKAKAAYRLLNNQRIDLAGLLKGHVEATAQRASDHDVVLAVQDSTSLNYSTHRSVEGLGHIGGQGNVARGLQLHDTVAFTEQGTPLGVLDVQCWARDPEQKGKKHKRRQLPIEEKESFKWLRSYRAVTEVQRLIPQTMLVSVGDREADLYELFTEAEAQPDGPKVLVRAGRGRKRKLVSEDGECPELWEQVSGGPLAGHQEIVVPRRSSQPERIARLEVRFATVQLRPPPKSKLPSVALWAVHAVEVGHDDEVTSPLEWLLLTNVAVSSFDEAIERLRWYTIRWNIEVYHRVLKSGCRIEDRQLGDTHSLKNCLAIDMVVAWRVFHLTKLGRETPDVPCDVILEELEWKALHAAVHKTAPPDEPPSLREAVRMIALLGGFLGRKGDGEPGPTTVWRGLLRLDGIKIGYAAAMELVRQRDGP